MSAYVNDDAGVPARTVQAPAVAWSRVATYVAERQRALGVTAADLVDRAGGRGLSVVVISRLLNVRQTSYSQRTLSTLSRALNWTPDSIERILKGEEPICVVATTNAATSPNDDRIAALEAALPRLEAELQEVKAALASEMAQVRDLVMHGAGRSATPLPVDPTDINPDTMVPNQDDPDEMQLWGYSTDQGGTREPDEIVQLVIEYRRRKYGLPPQHGASDTA